MTPAEKYRASWANTNTPGGLRGLESEQAPPMIPPTDTESEVSLGQTDFSVADARETMTRPTSRETQNLQRDVAQSTKDATLVDSGGWSYKLLGDGRVEILSTPSTSKLKPGSVLDPKLISNIADPKQRARVEYAYKSIINKFNTGEALPAKAQPAKKTPAGGATPAPAASAAPSDTLRMQKTPEDAPGPGISAVSPPPAAEIPKPGSSPGRLPNTKSFLNNFR